MRYYYWIKSRALSRKLKKTTLKACLILDVDGVLTDGSFTYTIQGKVGKVFGSHDSDALHLIKDYIEIFFISADKKGFPISRKRIEDMGFILEYVSAKEREDYIKRKKICMFCIFVGDSFTDVPALKIAQFGITPANAHKLAKRNANLVLRESGGSGAVSEIALLLADILGLENNG